MKLWYLLGLFLISPIIGSSQNLNSEELQYLNKEIKFLNESIDAMVIIFWVFKDYNSEVTKHVDLPRDGGIENTSSNLPDNLFADNSLVIRGDSPIELFNQLSADPMRDAFPINNWSLMKEGKDVIDFLNKDRKKVNAIVENEDMEVFANIQAVFKEIEDARDHFDKLRNTIKIFEKLHLNAYHDLELPTEQRQVYTALTELHYDIKKIVRQIRNDNQSGVINGVRKLEKELGWARTCIRKIKDTNQQSDLQSITVTIEKLIEEIKKYTSGAPIPDDYLPYGKGFYFHNTELLPKINQYGTGYVWKLEEFFKKYDWNVINFIEEPHYLKMVYPELLPLEIMTGDQLPPNQNIREIAPPELPQIDKLVVEKKNDNAGDVDSEDGVVVKNEELVETPYDIVLNQVIRVDSASFEIELFDHYRKDGDRVSINVNGEWVHRLISLEEKKRTIELSIQPGVSNYIILRADNVGWTTPNTVGIRYRSKNPDKTIVIKKDLLTNQAIELKFSQ